MSQITKMKHANRSFVRGLVGSLLSGALIFTASSGLANQSMSSYSALPPLAYTIDSGRSVMLTLSVDHQLFMKAYNDYSDLTGDGFPNNTYTPDYPYVGYFDSTVCYSQLSQTDGGDGVFRPVGERTEPGKRCEAGQWHGNFLNWATMTRIDLLRQVLYGGFRLVDDPDLTILERSYLPHDAHSFAKYVPWDAESLTGLAVVPTSNTECGTESGVECEGFTFCNTTRPPSGPNATAFSQRVTEPPLLRVVKGDYRFWDASERYQCLTTTNHYPADGSEGDVGAHSEAKWLEASINGGFDLSGANLNDVELTGVAAFPKSPLIQNVRDYIVRVEVCNSNFPPVNLEEGEESVRMSYECTSYGSFSKPTGLLHEHGTSGDRIRFGLMTGSYNSNKDYGVLRKAPSSFAEEIDDDGTFKELDGGSIVANIDALRIVDYRYYDPSTQHRGTYRSTDGGARGCEWGMTWFDNGICRNWGNPFSEILAESYRFLAGAETASVNDDVDNEVALLPGLSVIRNWAGLREEAADGPFSCARGSVLGINASAVSYDWSETFAGQTTNDLGILGFNSSSLADLTNDLLTGGGEYFVGAVDDNDNGLCTPKDVGNHLGEARGTCPETPRLEGGYLGAGLANHMYENEGISTFGVSLSDALPRIRLWVDAEDGEREVVIVPACRNRGHPRNEGAVSTNPAWSGVTVWNGARGGNCALVSFKVIEDVLSDGIRKGTYFVGWEDSEQGGDYDIDASGLIRFELDGSSLRIETQLIYNGSPDRMEFGFVISGTDNDNAYFPAHTPGFASNMGSLTYGDVGGWTTTTPGCNDLDNCIAIENNVQELQFQVQGSAVDFLPSPLRLAATHGSSSGEAGYANVENPALLRTQLGRILGGVFNEPTPGTGAAPATNVVGGEGLVISTIYQPDLGAGEGNVKWSGRFNALFYRDGYFWEDCHTGDYDGDTSGRGIINDRDCIVQIRLDPATNQTVFDRYSNPTRDEEGRIRLPAEPSVTGLSYSELRPLWSADQQLAQVNLPGTQRAFDTVNSRQRHILTAIPRLHTGFASRNDVFDFTADEFGVRADRGLEGNNFRLLNAGNQEQAAQLVNYIRGDETIPEARNRTFDGRPHLLGDIMHSSAAVIGRPSAHYGSPRIGDTTYWEYQNKHRDRRIVTYVGSNSGMLHAFNGGFRNDTAAGSGYVTTPPGSEGLTPHALGAELWGYVPYNLLPHLKWLKDSNYSHVYYVDGDVQTFDVNIFHGDGYSNDIYPNGWGTIIVARMRLGGGEYQLDSTGDNELDRTLRSAYIVMDVTDPEQPPKLLAEFTDEDLGFTTSNVDVVHFRSPNSFGVFGDPSSTNEWFLVFGSGPRGTGAMHNATSDQNAKLFFVDLKALREGETDLIDIDTGVENAYVGGVTAVDWNGDFNTDMVYFGVVGTGEESGGALMQVPVSMDNIRTRSFNPNPLLTDVNLPFSSAPLVVRDFSADGYWVYAGTGHLMVSDHLLPENIDNNWLYGVRVNSVTGPSDKPWLTEGGVLAREGLRNISHATVATSVETTSGLRSFVVADLNPEPYPDTEEVTTPEAMERAIRENFNGWRKRLPNQNELMFTSPAFTGSTLAASSFSPSIGDVDECQATGTGRLYWLNLFTGLPQTENRTIYLQSSGPIASDSDQGGTLSDVAREDNSVIVGASPSGPDIIVGGNEGDGESFSAEPPPGTAARRAWREVSGDDFR